MCRITQSWLRSAGIGYDQLVIERASHHGRRGHNRFEDASKGLVKYFVEDDPANAAILAEYCEMVFLVAQPYNAVPIENGRILRVDSWGEIVQHIRRADLAPS
jgi:uncharacterized HAD superfamily protein